MDLPRYLARIGCEGCSRPSSTTLAALHRGHVTSIPFENLDIQLGLPIDLGIEALERKLVDRRRGGYCYEQNTLALHALRSIGFDVSPCEARVRGGGAVTAPRTHMVLLVRLEGRGWLWDSGFGGETPLEPVPMDGEGGEQGGAFYRVAKEGSLRVLQTRVAAEWRDLYAFVPEPREPIDFEVGNWYTSTHPRSRFVTTLTAQLRTAEGSRVLRNLTYTVTTGAAVASRDIARSELLPLLREDFGLELPPGVEFRALSGDRLPAAGR